MRTSTSLLIAALTLTVAAPSALRAQTWDGGVRTATTNAARSATTPAACDPGS